MDKLITKQKKEKKQLTVYVIHHPGTGKIDSVRSKEASARRIVKADRDLIYDMHTILP